MQYYNNKNKKKDTTTEHRTPWHLLSDEEKAEIKKKAEVKRKELERLENIKNADIMTGKQKTVDTAWE